MKVFKVISMIFGLSLLSQAAFAGTVIDASGTPASICAKYALEAAIQDGYEIPSDLYSLYAPTYESMTYFFWVQKGQVLKQAHVTTDSKCNILNIAYKEVNRGL